MKNFLFLVFVFLSSFLSAQTDTVSVSGEITLTINYSRTLQEMIDAGNYDWVDNYFTEKGSLLLDSIGSSEASVSVKIFKLKGFIFSEDAVAEMLKDGFRPATLAELLALGEAYPEIQKENPIIALYSVYFVPVLFSDNDRSLGITGHGLWGSGYRFLGVRK